jgi:hypothetical protein
MTVLSLVFSVLLLSGCTTAKKMLFGNGTVSKNSIRAYLDMPASVEVDVNSVRSAALEALPVGVSEVQIYGFLDNHRVSRSPSDFMAFYMRKNQQNEITCLLSYNSAPGLRATYHIKYLLSEQKTLKDVSVTESQENL